MLKSLLLAALVLVPLAAAADDKTRTPDVRQMHTDDCAKARAANRTCIIDMNIVMRDRPQGLFHQGVQKRSLAHRHASLTETTITC